MHDPRGTHWWPQTVGLADCSIYSPQDSQNRSRLRPSASSLVTSRAINSSLVLFSFGKLVTMYLFLAAALVSLASTAATSVEMQSFSLFTRSGLDKRATCTVDQITPESCEKCFGPGYVNCLTNTCYNPGAGASCCSNGCKSLKRIQP